MDVVEDLHWRKASYSGNGGNCLEVASTPGKVLVRDTKRREASALAVDADGWRMFIAAVRAGTLTGR